MQYSEVKRIEASRNYVHTTKFNVVQILQNGPFWPACLDTCSSDIYAHIVSSVSHTYVCMYVHTHSETVAKGASCRRVCGNLPILTICVYISSLANTTLGLYILYILSPVYYEYIRTVHTCILTFNISAMACTSILLASIAPCMEARTINVLV